jgi:putative ABC transport system ATP-binding protein
MIELENVTLTFPDGDRRVTAVDAVSLSVERGSIVGITGPSGSGKSSLLAVASTLIRPASGHVVIDDVDVTRFTLRQRSTFRRERLGIIFQQPNLLPSLTAEDQLVVMSRLDGRPVRGSVRGAARARARELLDAVGLLGQAKKFPAQLSGGERQRVDIARALMNNPTVLVIDEPTSALDQERGARVLDLIMNLTIEQNTATLLVTHDESVLGRIDRVFSMTDGRLSQATMARDSNEFSDETIRTFDSDAFRAPVGR